MKYVAYKSYKHIYEIIFHLHNVKLDQINIYNYVIIRNIWKI